MRQNLDMLFHFLLLLTFVGHHSYCHAKKTRTYYIAAEDVEWDYAPTNTNVITNETVRENSIEGEFLIGGPDRIGGKYGKTVYVGYTDDTFTEVIPKADWQGFLGPIIYGEIGDTIKVLFKNQASRPYSLHVHGLLYDKSSEGAKYEDKTSAKQRLDDSVVPGSSHTYTYQVDEISGPAEGDPNCIAWPYHSHISTPRGTNTGVVGAIVTCRKGTYHHTSVVDHLQVKTKFHQKSQLVPFFTGGQYSDVTIEMTPFLDMAGILDDNGRRTDVAKDFVLLVTVTDENLSYHIDKNIEEYCGDPGSVDPEDEDFQESNKMHNINGYVYGNLPGLDICLGDLVAWHVFGLGTETDLHTLFFHGNILTIRNHRRDSFSVSPGVFITGEMTALNTGTWLMTSEVNTHFRAGTQALYSVDHMCGKDSPVTPQPTKTREYFIQAEEVMWNYAPSGVDGFDGVSVTDVDSPAYPFFLNTTERIGRTYKKALYIGYTDNTFSTRLVRGDEEQHLGFLGPIIRAEVGEEIIVTFRNGASRNYSILPHGVMYDKAHEGSGYNDGTSGTARVDDAIAPGEDYTYRWMVPEHYGPTMEDDDCLTWLYYSAVDAERDVYSGLVGPLLVCRPGALDDDGKRNGVVEFHMLFMTVDENRSWYIEENIETFTDLTPDDARLADEEFVESNAMEAINGYSFANLPGLNEICPDQKVSWHMSTLGSDTDQHTVYFRGHTVALNGRHVDTISLTPGNSVTSRMMPTNKGTWGIECMTNSHFVSGMKALYTVTSTCNAATEMSSTVDIVRTFYIAAKEIVWDFAPMKYNFIKNQSLLDEESSGNVFVKQEGPLIGSAYKKAVFCQYTDETFMEEVSREPSQQHLGILGPVIHAEVGDQITVVFKNMATRQYSMHPHGVMYDKSLEAASGRGVQPGNMQTYTWNIPAEAGPGDGDRECVLYAYYSDTDRVRDTHSGLIGPLVICEKGILGSDGMRADVAREFVILFNVFDENQSWYLDDNIEAYSPEQAAVDKTDEEFEESNLMHGINGFLFGTLRHLEMYVDETVEWYLMSVGEEVDIHTVHFHGQSVLYQQYTKHRIDVIELFPGVFSTVQMKLKEAGSWLLHCHVNDHLLGGMVTTYEVKESPKNSTGHLTSTHLVLIFLANLLVMILHQ